MKLIIDIPEELTEKDHFYTEKEKWSIIDAIRNGTPLQKGYGRILDEKDILDKIRAEIEHYNLRPSNYPCDMISIGIVLQIIDKYKAEREG